MKETQGNVWVGGLVPVDEPKCGFTGSKCDNSPYIIGGGVAAAVLAFVLLVIGYSQYQSVNREITK